MATNQFLPFGIATGANVLSNSAWAALTARLAGFSSGVALSAQVNKPLRQATVMASMIGSFTAAYGGDALDDADLVTLQAHFEAALAHIVRANLPDPVDLSGYLLKSGGTMTGLLVAPAGLQTAARVLPAGGALSAADYGKLIEVTASWPVAVDLPTPAGNGGASYVIWANSVANHIIRTPAAGVFQGPSASGLTTMTLPAGAVYTVVSDGYNWVLSAANVVPQAKTVVQPRLTWALSSQYWSRQDGSTYALVACTGGGGGGGDGGSGSRGGGGGGGGETTITLLNVSSISSVLVSIGAGGSRSAGASVAGDGGTTTFGDLVSAVGGKGGGAGTSAGRYGSGGAGGVNTAGPGAVHLAGGPGSQSTDESGGLGGGGLFGNGGGLSSGYATVNAQSGIRGGGGGGGHGPSASAGGNGGSGCCLIVEW